MTISQQYTLYVREHLVDQVTRRDTKMNNTEREANQTARCSFTSVNNIWLGAEMDWQCTLIL